MGRKDLRPTIVHGLGMLLPQSQLVAADVRQMNCVNSPEHGRYSSLASMALNVHLEMTSHKIHDDAFSLVILSVFICNLDVS